MKKDTGFFFKVQQRHIFIWLLGEMLQIVLQVTTMDSTRRFPLPKWEFRNSFAALSMEKDIGSRSAWGHWRDLNKTQFMMFKFIKEKSYKMGNADFEMHTKYESKSLLSCIVGWGKSVCKIWGTKQNGAEYPTFLSEKITGTLGKGELLKLC